VIIHPKVRGFICTTAHPLGCLKEVTSQIEFVERDKNGQGPKHALIIGASTGYGLASRIKAAFATENAKTVGVSYEKPPQEKRTATPGWYNTAAFEKVARDQGRYAKSINGDAFSKVVKQQIADILHKDLKKIDLVVYSLATPRRIHPLTGEIYTSVLKPIGKSFTSKTVDPFRFEIKEITLQPATQLEIDHTVQVMGGEDWEMWINFLAEEGLLAEGVTTIAYSYLGPLLTHPVYKSGTIGKAKEHLHETAEKLNDKLRTYEGRALISVNKAIVTQASAAIPIVPLYISLLFKLMKQKGTHEGAIQQISRLFKDFLYAPALSTEKEGLIRIDEFEMQPDIQDEISNLWPNLTSDNLMELTDIKGYCEDFYRLFGFGNETIDYTKDVDPVHL
jgi:enoyl-[acyl-carrier protein] reductase / trans-2-enoyl-CoA reductase (NAD+)